MKQIIVEKVENGYLIWGYEPVDEREWIAKSLYDVREVLESIWEPKKKEPKEDASKDSYNQLCKTCGKRYGAHYGENCDWPARPGQLFQGTGEYSK